MLWTAIIEDAADGGYGAYVPDLPGCVSCGDTPGQALDSIREAVQRHLQVMRDNGDPIPKPRSFASVVHAA